MEMLIYGWDWLGLKGTSFVGMIGLVAIFAAFIFKVRFKIPNPKKKEGSCDD